MSFDRQSTLSIGKKGQSLLSLLQVQDLGRAPVCTAFTPASKGVVFMTQTLGTKFTTDHLYCSAKAYFIQTTMSVMLSEYANQQKIVLAHILSFT